MLETFGILNIWAYALGALIIVMIPGPNTLFVLKTSIVDGRRAGFTAAAGVFTGDAVLVFLAYLGIAALVLAHPEVFFWLSTPRSSPRRPKRPKANPKSSSRRAAASSRSTATPLR